MAALTKDELHDLFMSIDFRDDELGNAPVVVKRIVKTRLDVVVDEWVRRVHESYCGPECKSRDCEGMPNDREVQILRAVVREAGA